MNNRKFEERHEPYEELDEKIKKFDKEIIHALWTIFVSIVTTVIVVLAATG